MFDKWENEMLDEDSEIYIQVKECDKIKENRLKSALGKSKSNNHLQAIYTSRNFNFKNLPEPVNNSASSNPVSIERGEKIPLEVGDVTYCLTICHNECSGKYIDSTGKFIINCLCKCHDKNHTIVTKEDE